MSSSLATIESSLEQNAAIKLSCHVRQFYGQTFVCPCLPIEGVLFFSFPEIESELMKIMIIMITGQHLLLRQRRKRPKRKKGRNNKSGDVALIRINIIYLLYWPTHISSHTRSFSLSLTCARTRTHMHPHHIISHTTTLFITHVLSLSFTQTHIHTQKDI